jgi:hypothetical protein
VLVVQPAKQIRQGEQLAAKRRSELHPPTKRRWQRHELHGALVFAVASGISVCVCLQAKKSPSRVKRLVRSRWGLHPARTLGS